MDPHTASVLAGECVQFDQVDGHVRYVCVHSAEELRDETIERVVNRMLEYDPTVPTAPTAPLFEAP